MRLDLRLIRLHPGLSRRKAREAREYPLLKLKVDATRHLDVVRLVRNEHPHARLVVDANQAWTITVTNNGPTRATSVEVLDFLPAGMSIVLCGSQVTESAPAIPASFARCDSERSAVPPCAAST